MLAVALGWFKAGSGNFAKRLHDGAVVAYTIGEFDVALHFSSAEGAADDVGCGDLGDTGRCNGDSQACSYEPQDGEPLGRLLHDVGAKTMFFAE